MFSSFSSCSPRYRKVYSRIEKELEEENLLRHVCEESHRRSLSRTDSAPSDSSGDSTFLRTPAPGAGDASVRRLSGSSPELPPPGGRLPLTSTPESSQTESDEVSPQVQRRRRPGIADMPRFALSVDEDTTRGRLKQHRFSAPLPLPLPPIATTTATSATPTTLAATTVAEPRELSPVAERSTRAGSNRRGPEPGISGSGSTSSSGSSTATGSTSVSVTSKQEAGKEAATATSSRPTTPKLAATPPMPTPSPPFKLRSRSVIKSASASGLSLIIPSDDLASAAIDSSGGTHSGVLGSPGGSSTSSRDTSPSRELSPLVAQLKPPIIIQRGPRGFGFTIRAIRVYYGDSDVYTVQHLVMAVENNSPAFEAGLRPGDLITHINGEAVQGLLHPQVLQLILAGGSRIHIRTTPLESTSIRTGGRKRNPTTSRLARRNTRQRRTSQGPATLASKLQGSPPAIGSKPVDKKRRASLLRRLSNKRATAEIQQLVSGGVATPTGLAPSRSFQSLVDPASGSPPSRAGIAINFNKERSSSDSSHSTSNSSPSSSPSSSVPNSPAGSGAIPPGAGGTAAASVQAHFQRPSSLHGLKHKLAQTFRSPRRKSVGHIPLSPLARTPSPSPLPAISPTRSPSPLAFPPGQAPPAHHSHHPHHHHGHHPAAIVATQSPQVFAAGRKASPPTLVPAAAAVASSTRKSLMRPKSAEPGSPLLRRALSPDRLHPKSAESKPRRESFCTHASPLALTSTPSTSQGSPPRVVSTKTGSSVSRSTLTLSPAGTRMPKSASSLAPGGEGGEEKQQGGGRARSHSQSEVESLIDGEEDAVATTADAATRPASPLQRSPREQHLAATSSVEPPHDVPSFTVTPSTPLPTGESEDGTSREPGCSDTRSEGVSVTTASVSLTPSVCTMSNVAVTAKKPVLAASTTGTIAMTPVPTQASAVLSVTVTTSKRPQSTTAAAAQTKSSSTSSSPQTASSSTGASKLQPSQLPAETGQKTQVAEAKRVAAKQPVSGEQKAGAVPQNKSKSMPEQPASATKPAKP